MEKPLLLLSIAFLFGACSPQSDRASLDLIPAPAEWVPDRSSCSVTGSWELEVTPEWAERRQFWGEWLAGDTPATGAKAVPVAVDMAAGLEPEAYTLSIRTDGIRIEASTEAGAFHALTTLRSLALTSDGALPCGVISDAPRFEHRGLLLDCCRHFMEPEFVKRMIDLLALHKMNVLHWHLTEDQGWRVEIDAYPELTQTGAWRTEADGSQHGGFYTKGQIRAIVAYAAQRNITVIPEIELPGHSRAALAAYPWLGCTGEAMEVPHDWGVFKDIYCAGQDTTLAFLKTVLDEVMELFPSEYIHIGGDEAPKVRWEQCPKCQKRIADEGLHDEHELQSWFIGEIGQYLESKGRKMIGWDEILEGGLPAGATVQSWRGMDGGRDAVAMGHDAIMSPTSHCYFDYPVESTDMEEVYGFEPVPEGLEGSGRILGGECNMWSERAPQHLVESKVFPRMVAMAEVLWSPAENRDWAAFTKRMESHYTRLDVWDVRYGWETVPLSLEWERGEEANALKVALVPAMAGVHGQAAFIPHGATTPELEFVVDQVARVQGEGVLEVALTRKGVSMGAPLLFPLAGHAGAFRPVELEHELNAYYPGRGEQGLADGRLGSMDFRDGSWQAVQGGNMGVTIALDDALLVDSLSMQVYRYQDAWIFLPDSVRFQWSLDGEAWEGDWLVRPFEGGRPTFEPNDLQDVQRVAVPVGKKARWVRFEAVNPGPCPDWHDAASSATWLFLDELVVHSADTSLP
jgi:hexosaminidase